MQAESGGRLIAIGDIHGCVHALDAILNLIQPSPDDTLIVLGDFIDQGRNTREVIDCLIELEDQCRLICLKGNHEEMLLAALDSESARRYWENAGGVATITSYRFGGSILDIPPNHLRFIATCEDYYETEEFIFVHANLEADLPLADQPHYALRWTMLDPASTRCHASGKTAIVGHTEQDQGEILDLGCFTCIDTACWRYGWLTALDVRQGQIWQASRFGMVRDNSEMPMEVKRFPGSN